MLEDLKILVLKILDFIINIFDKFYHQKRIIKVLKNIKIKYNLIIDVGFHLGDYSSLFIEKLDVNKIIGYEASKSTFKKVHKNFSGSKIILKNFAISSKQGVKKLYIYKKGSINSFTEMRKTSFYYKIKKIILDPSPNNYEIVRLNTLDNLLKNKKTIDLLKIDVEGHELEVLKGSNKTLDKTRIILIEIHNTNQYKNYSKNKIYDLLKKKKFICYKKIKFPLMNWEDQIYINEKNLTYKIK